MDNIPKGLKESLDKNLMRLLVSKDDFIKALGNDIVVKNIPDGCFVMNVDFSMLHRCFDVVLWHPSFEEMPPFSQLPIIEAEIEIIKDDNKKRKLTY